MSASAGPRFAAPVLGLRFSRSATHWANQESGMHIPVRIGEITITTGMNGKS
ncbi:hypothetical protein GCM10009730_15750 [Streptomyces albidochromogenes]